MESALCKREIRGIALLLFAVFLGGALAVARLSRSSTRRRATYAGNVGWSGALPRAARSSRSSAGPPPRLLPLVPAVHALRLFGRLESRDGPLVDDLLRGHGRAAADRRRRSAQGRSARSDRAGGTVGQRSPRSTCCSSRGSAGAWIVVALARQRAHGGDAALESDSRRRRPSASRRSTSRGRRRRPSAPGTRSAARRSSATAASATIPRARSSRRPRRCRRSIRR